MNQRLIFLGLLLVALNAEAVASPRDDLASPSQEVRTHAAELIRDNHLYKATPRAPWDELVSGLKVGDLLQDVLNRIQEKGIASPATADMLRASGEFGFRLDDSWELEFGFQDSRMVYYIIFDDPKEVRVEPPAGYTGFWRTYRINGKLASLYDYQNGRNLGNTLHMQ